MTRGQELERPDLRPQYEVLAPHVRRVFELLLRPNMNTELMQGVYIILHELSRMSPNWFDFIQQMKTWTTQATGNPNYVVNNARIEDLLGRVEHPGPPTEEELAISHAYRDALVKELHVVVEWVKTELKL